MQIVMFQEGTNTALIKPESKLKKTLGILAGVCGALAIVSFIFYAIQKVRTGHGLDYYFTGHGVQMSYIGGLIAFGILAIALLIGWFMRICFRKKYGNLPDGLRRKILTKNRT